QEAESHLHHLCSTGAVNDGVEITLACGLAKFRGNVLGGFVPDANGVIGPVVLSHREFVGVAGEGDDSCATSEDLGILNRVTAKSTDPKNSDHSVRAQRPGIAEFLDTSIRGQTRVGERREFLEFQTTLPHGGTAAGGGEYSPRARKRPHPRPGAGKKTAGSPDPARGANPHPPPGRQHHSPPFPHPPPFSARPRRSC